MRLNEQSWIVRSHDLNRLLDEPGIRALPCCAVELALLIAMLIALLISWPVVWPIHWPIDLKTVTVCQ